MFFLFLLAPTDPFPIYGFHFPLHDSLSLHTMNPEGFIFFFFPPPMALPLSQIRHLHQLPSNPVSLSPSLCFPSLFRFIVFTRFAPPPPHHPLTFLFLTLTCNPSFLSLQGTLLFVPLKPSPFHFAFPQQRHSSQTRIRAPTSLHPWLYHPPNTHLQPITP